MHHSSVTQSDNCPALRVSRSEAGAWCFPRARGGGKARERAHYSSTVTHLGVPWQLTYCGFVGLSAETGVCVCERVWARITDTHSCVETISVLYTPTFSQDATYQSDDQSVCHTVCWSVSESLLFCF